MPLLLCALLAACSISPVQSIIYAAADDTYVPAPGFANTPPQFAPRQITRPDGQTRQYFWHETANTTHTILYLHGNGEIAERTASLRDVAPAIDRPLIGAAHRYEALAAAPKVDVPWEIVHCTNDPIIPVRMARALADAPKLKPASRSLRIIPCNSHFVPRPFWPASLAMAKSG